MKRALLCILILASACSKGDSKGAVAVSSDDAAAVAVAAPIDAAGAIAPASPIDAAAESGDPSDGAVAGNGETPVVPDTTDTPDATDTPDTAAKSNLKVLPKSWSQAKVKKYMKQFTTGLGVKCKHCHEKGDFASDSMPAKLNARKMLKMTRKLNKEYYSGKGVLTCNTCHKGKLEF